MIQWETTLIAAAGGNSHLESDLGSPRSARSEFIDSTGSAQWDERWRRVSQGLRIQKGFLPLVTHPLIRCATLPRSRWPHRDVPWYVGRYDCNRDRTRAAVFHAPTLAAGSYSTAGKRGGSALAMIPVTSPCMHPESTYATSINTTVNGTTFRHHSLTI